MTDNQSPSGNPADDGTLTGMMKTALRKFSQELNVMMPVEIVAFDRATNRATVKHLIQMTGSDGEKVDRAQISSVRVQQPGSAAFSMSFPHKPGDKGWIIAADRDISLFQQDLKNNPSNTGRMHSFEDGLFMPDSMAMGDVPGDDADRTYFGAVDGSSRLAFGSGYVGITVGGVKFEVTASGVAITGGTVTHNGVNIGATHVHGGVLVGGADTAIPH